MSCLPNQSLLMSCRPLKRLFTTWSPLKSLMGKWPPWLNSQPRWPPCLNLATSWLSAIFFFGGGGYPYTYCTQAPETDCWCDRLTADVSASGRHPGDVSALKPSHLRSPATLCCPSCNGGHHFECVGCILRPRGLFYP